MLGSGDSAYGTRWHGGPEREAREGNAASYRCQPQSDTYALSHIAIQSDSHAATPAVPGRKKFATYTMPVPPCPLLA